MPDILKNSLAYLIGAIDAANDQGVSWRQELINTCKANNLHIKFLDPTNKITGLQKEIGKEHEQITTLKRDHQYDELSKLMKRIVREDHRCVDISDFVIFYLDTSIHTCGSYFELQSAMTQKKPYFIIVKQGKDKLPSWLFGICDHNYVYSYVEEVTNELILLNNGDKELSDRWVLFRNQLAEL